MRKTYFRKKITKSLGSADIIQKSNCLQEHVNSDDIHSCIYTVYDAGHPGFQTKVLASSCRLSRDAQAKQ